MRKLIACLLILIGLLSSCEKGTKDGVLELGYKIEFSERISNELILQATKIPSADTHFINYEEKYTSYDSVLIRFAPIGTDKVLLPSASSERINSVIHWYRSILDPLYPEHKTEVIAPYSTSCLSQRIKITADVSLYGEDPGTDLSKHFLVLTKPNLGSFKGHLLRSFDYQIVARYDPWKGLSLPCEVDEYFVDDLVLFCVRKPQDDDILEAAYCIVFKDSPTMRPKEMTLTITLPVKEKLLSEAFAQGGAMDASKIKDRDRVLFGQVKLSFPN
ncbi:MAG: hypothetical protein IJ654_01435 [Bacteroidales bacterium]|nr:hypothetical protein [Bacteroidales bacterium]